MPIPTFTFPEDLPGGILEHVQDGMLRQRFVRETYAFLSYLVEGDREEGEAEARYEAEDRYPGLSADEFPFLHQAWNEVGGSFHTLAQSVMHIESPTVARHGIGGAQLRFKLGNVARWSQRLADLPSPDGAPMMRLPRPWRKYIQYLLDSINNLLKSILAAVGAGSAVQEIKDAIKDAVRWLFED